MRERLNQQTTKLGGALFLVGAALFPDVDWAMFQSTCQDWWQATLNLYDQVGIVWPALMAVAGRWIFVNRDRV